MHMVKKKEKRLTLTLRANRIAREAERGTKKEP